jgi:hypothetical protein
MAQPEDVEAYVRVTAGDLVIYIERVVLESLAPDARQLVFVMDLRRRHRLFLGRPARELLDKRD